MIYILSSYISNCIDFISLVTIALSFQFLHLDCKNVFYLFIEKLNDVVILSSLILVSNHDNVYPENATLVIVLKMFIKQISSEISNSVKYKGVLCYSIRLSELNALPTYVMMLEQFVFTQPLIIPIFLARSDTETKQNNSKLYVR